MHLTIHLFKYIIPLLLLLFTLTYTAARLNIHSQHVPKAGSAVDETLIKNGTTYYYGFGFFRSNNFLGRVPIKTVSFYPSGQIHRKIVNDKDGTFFTEYYENGDIQRIYRKFESSIYSAYGSGFSIFFKNSAIESYGGFIPGEDSVVDYGESLNRNYKNDGYSEKYCIDGNVFSHKDWLEWIKRHPKDIMFTSLYYTSSIDYMNSIWRWILIGLLSAFLICTQYYRRRKQASAKSFRAKLFLSIIAVLFILPLLGEIIILVNSMELFNFTFSSTHKLCEYYQDGKLKAAHYVFNEFGDEVIRSYYPNGRLASECGIIVLGGKKLRHGRSANYSEDESLLKEEYFLLDKASSREKWSYQWLYQCPEDIKYYGGYALDNQFSLFKSAMMILLSFAVAYGIILILYSLAGTRIRCLKTLLTGGFFAIPFAIALFSIWLRMDISAEYVQYPHYGISNTYQYSYGLGLADGNNYFGKKRIKNVIFYPSGTKKAEYYYGDDNHLCRLVNYYENGEKSSEYQVKEIANGISYSGAFFTYYENGNLKTRGKKWEADDFYYLSKLEEYSPNGVLISKRYYNGRRECTEKEYVSLNSDIKDKGNLFIEEYLAGIILSIILSAFAVFLIFDFYKKQKISIHK